MCQFKSAIVTANGDLLHNPWTDSHEDLVRIFKLNDTATPSGEPRFARVEFKPESPDDLDKPSAYLLSIDERRTPEWFTDELKTKTSDRLRIIIAGMIVSGEADLLCGGAYILAAGAKVATVKNAYVHVMMKGSKVGEMRGSSKVGEMWESSNVGEMRESSKVGEMRGSSNVGVMWGSSKVGVMWESSNVGVMRESSNVGVMRGSSKVGVMRGSSKVENDNRTVKL